MKRLVVVSNRVADWSSGKQSGGLAVALQEALQVHGGLWFGWSGDVVSEDAPRSLGVQECGNVSLATIPLSEEDYREYYAGFSNSVLWPIFHYRLDIAHFEPGFWDGYVRVVRTFARHIANLIEPDDIIWVHDYHLIPLAAELRAIGARQKIGFFLHIPFPPPDILAAAPHHRNLIHSLFAYDLVGLQTHADVSNLERVVADIVHARVRADGVYELEGQRVRVGAFPIGIDADAFAAMAATPEAQEQIELLQRRITARAHIIGVDRLDYTKGLPQRLRAFQRFIETYPEYWKAVTLMQIAPPTREDVTAYIDIRHELEALSGQINGELGDFDWTPVRYIHRAVPRETLAALFRGSQVGLVTPLRDGMNLVAKEYVAAQNEENPGVLILSRFAGAAEELHEALIVNPYDIDEMVEALHRALSMPLGERRERHGALLARVRDNNIGRWRETFLKMLMETELEASA